MTTTREEDINLLIFRNKNNQKKQEDIKYGLEQEQLSIKILNKYFNDTLHKSKNIYCSYDFIGSKTNTLYELKSNKYSIKRYPYALITKNKIEKYQDYENIIKIIFSYQECYDNKIVIEYYYINFISYENFIKKYKLRLIEISRNELIWNYDIPITELIKII
jgi:hypothetical protein